MKHITADVTDAVLKAYAYTLRDCRRSHKLNDFTVALAHSVSYGVTKMVDAIGTYEMRRLADEAYDATNMWVESDMESRACQDESSSKALSDATKARDNAILALVSYVANYGAPPASPTDQ